MAISSSQETYEASGTDLTSRPSASLSGRFDKVTGLSLRFDKDEDIFATCPLTDLFSLKHLKISGGKVGLPVERAQETPDHFLELKTLRLKYLRTHNARGNTLGNVLSAVLASLPISYVGHLSIKDDSYGARYDEAEVQGSHVRQLEPVHSKTVKIGHIVFDRRASTYDQFKYLSQIIAPGTLKTVRVKPGTWKDVEGLRALLAAAQQPITELDISLTKIIEDEQFQGESYVCSRLYSLC